jgi:predicted O-methyltransferase YrrM
MIDAGPLGFVPPQVEWIAASCAALDFRMSCTAQTGALLRTLAAAKPGGRVLELGTGAGMSTAWLLSGMSRDSTLVTVESDPRVAAVARAALGADERVELVEGDAGELLDRIKGQRFDLVFADTWVGKFERLDETLALLAPGGLYVIDDLLPQPTWPPGHQGAVTDLVKWLATVAWLALTRLDWASGILIGSRTDPVPTTRSAAI